MRKVFATIGLLVIALQIAYCQKIAGVTVVAPPDPVGIEAFERVKKINTNWVCLVPYGYHRQGQTQVKYNVNWQWWGEKKEGLIECIKHAKQSGHKVLLKPQVYIPGSWVGDLTYDKEEDWKEWEESYHTFMMFFVEIAVQENVDMICIGTEYKKAIIEREHFWRQLISNIRSIYKGDLVYSSNWDNYQNVPFWDALDLIGISAYFPLTDKTTPSQKELGRKWKPIKDEIQTYAKLNNKEVLFTEFGYLSTDKCAHKAWELESQIKQLNVNENAQANAYASLIKCFGSESWWRGGFIWKWFPNGLGHEGYPEKDYTPQDKKAEVVIRSLYSELIH